MGTDIHPFVEVDHGTSRVPFSDPNRIFPFNTGEFIWNRDYRLFNALGDGRNFHFSEAEIDRHSLYPPRGLPAHLGFAVENRYFHLVDDYFNHTYPRLPPLADSQADDLIASGKSILGRPFENKDGAVKRRVSYPSWHSASWLLLSEINGSLKHFDYSLEDASGEAQTTFALMKLLENQYGVGRARLVFWFDN